MTGVFEGIRQRHITRKGRNVTIKRADQTASIIAFFNIWAPDDLAPPLRQGDVRIDILADIAPLTTPPRNPDIILAADGTAWSVLFANPVYEANTLIGWTIAGRGA